MSCPLLRLGSGMCWQDTPAEGERGQLLLNHRGVKPELRAAGRPARPGLGEPPLETGPGPAPPQGPARLPHNVTGCGAVGLCVCERVWAAAKSDEMSKKCTGSPLPPANPQKVCPLNNWNSALISFFASSRNSGCRLSSCPMLMLYLSFKCF